MGVPHLFGRWLKGKYADLLSPMLPGNVSSLSLDANSIIHLACSIIFLYGDYDDPIAKEQLIAEMRYDPQNAINKVYALVFDIMLQVCLYINPRDTLIVAIDGVVPMGKIQQSGARRRRNGMSMDNNARAGIVSLFDTTSISPGTQFMEGLDIFLKAAFSAKFASFGVQRIIYSPHTVAGEGEHKIFDYFRKGRVVLNSNPDGAHIIYGMDADLIILSLMSDVKNLVLAKDSVPIHVNRYDGRSVSAQQRRGGDMRNVYIEGLRQALVTEMNRPSAVMDFCLIVSLVGNDFLPHPPSASNLKDTIDVMMELYPYTTGPLVRVSPAGTSPGLGKYKYDINWVHLLELLTLLGTNEPILMDRVAIASKEYKNPYRTLEMARVDESHIDYTKFRDYWYWNALSPMSSKAEVYDTEFTREAKHMCEVIGYTPSNNVSQDSVDDMCHHLLFGLNWVLQYYSRGSNAVTWKWYYPYRYSPLLVDIANYLSIKQTITKSTSPEDGEVRFNYLHQMLATIPPQSANLVPDQIKHLYSIQSPIIDLMPTRFEVDKDGASVDWVSVCMIPFVDYHRILAAVPNEYSVIQGKDKMFIPSDTSLSYNTPRVSPITSIPINRNISRGGGTSRGRGGRGRGRGSTNR